jgi:dihydroorotate dehydrogenase electron transfer subunit
MEEAHARGEGGRALVRDCRVVAARHYGEYTLLTFVAADIAARAHPGQFVMVAVPAPGFHLRRPISVFRVEADRVSLLLERRGGGTTLISAAEVGDALTLTGPIGTEFPLRNVPAAVLAGGGIGAAPLQFLADDLKAHGVELTAALGFRDARRARLANAFDIEPLWLATEDGSQGTRGTVCDLLDRVPLAAAAVLFACGPLAMLAAVQQWARRHELVGFASLEAHMACGSGVCHSCVLPTTKGYARVCAEGPVLPLEELVFP